MKNSESMLILKRWMNKDPFKPMQHKKEHE
jgi:hypothetical protein